MSESPVKLLDQLMHGFKKLDDEEVVVLSQVPPACQVVVRCTRACARHVSIADKDHRLMLQWFRS